MQKFYSARLAEAQISPWLSVVVIIQRKIIQTNVLCLDRANELWLCARAVLNTLHKFAHLFLTMTLSGRYYYHSHFTGEETEAKITKLLIQQKQRQNLNLDRQVTPAVVTLKAAGPHQPHKEDTDLNHSPDTAGSQTLFLAACLSFIRAKLVNFFFFLLPGKVSTVFKPHFLWDRKWTEISRYSLTSPTRIYKQGPDACS